MISSLNRDLQQISAIERFKEDTCRLFDFHFERTIYLLLFEVKKTKKVVNCCHLSKYY